MSDVDTAPASAPAPDFSDRGSLNDILDRPDPVSAPEPEAAPLSEPEAPEAGAPAPAAAPAEPETPSVPEGDTFPRSYVEELRQESAKYRTQAREFSDAFDGYDDDARAEMLGIVRDLVAAPESAAARMIEVAKALYGDEFEARIKDNKPRALTQDDLEREFQRREAQRAEQEAVAAVQREAAELGYPDESPEAVMLYGLAAKFHAGDLRAADKYLKDLKEAAVAEYLTAKQGQAEAFPPVTTGGAAPSPASEVKTFDDARKAFLNSFG